MKDLGKLRVLAELLESATEPSGRLDMLIWDALDPESATNFYIGLQHSYSNSIDATVALIQRALPRWGWQVCDPRDATPFPPFAVLRNPDSATAGDAEGPTPALALLKSVVAAAIEEAELESDRTSG